MQPEEATHPVYCYYTLLRGDLAFYESGVSITRPKESTNELILVARTLTVWIACLRVKKPTTECCDR